MVTKDRYKDFAEVLWINWTIRPILGLKKSLDSLWEELCLKGYPYLVVTPRADFSDFVLMLMDMLSNKRPKNMGKYLKKN